jgi:hypothetical protein
MKSSKPLLHPVIPAKAGIQFDGNRILQRPIWTPASAGVTWAGFPEKRHAPP